VFPETQETTANDSLQVRESEENVYIQQNKIKSKYKIATKMKLKISINYC
jgi:hypothetical protein